MRLRPRVEPTKTPEPPWLTSRHYPKDKINFEDEIWKILTAKWGLADFQAAGLMSSIQAESSFSPYNAQGMGGPDDRGKYLYSTRDSVGFGLCQWTSSGRKAALQHGIVPLPKSVTPERIAANADVFDFALTDAEMAALDAMPETGYSGFHPDDAPAG